MPMPRGAGRATYLNVHNFTKIIDFKKTTFIDSIARDEDLYKLSYPDPAYPKNLGLDPDSLILGLRMLHFAENYVKSSLILKYLNFLTVEKI
jgi:hypothetical protein